MRRVGKGFSGRETPLFLTMMVQAQEEMGEGLANPTDPHHTPTIIQPSTSQPQKKQKPRKPKRKDTEVVVAGVNTPQSDEDSLKLKELMEFCTKLQQRVLDLEYTKTAQAQKITSLKLRVEKLEKKRGSRTHKLRRLYKVGRSARVVSSDESRITLNSTHFDADTDMFGVHDIDGDEVVVESEVAAMKKDDEVNVVEEVVSAAEETVNAATITKDEITLAQVLAELKSVKPKVTTSITATTKVILLQEPSESITTTTILSKNKGKGIIVEEPLKMKKKDQISFDEQEAIRLQAEFNKELRLAREKYEANVTLIEEWNDIQAKIDADYQIAKQIQAEEQEEFSSEVRAEGSETREESSSKRAGDELEQEKAKKQKVDEDKETAELQSLMKVIPDEEEITVDAIPLATKPPSIVDFKILKEGKISYYQYIRADGSSKRYSAFIQMLRIFDKEDLETLWKLGRIVGIKRLLDDFRVTTAKLMLLVQKLLLLVLEVNAAGMKVTTAERLQLLEEFMLTEKRSKTYQRKYKYFLKIKIT
ncbi:hypothetical protein Tco_1406592 [Tanacetum coccineum]